MPTSCSNASIKDDIAPKVEADTAYQNARKNTPASAEIEHDAARRRIVVTLLKDDAQFGKNFFENESFRRFVTDRVRDLNRAA